jgi:hypothetical protein
MPIKLTAKEREAIRVRLMDDREAWAEVRRRSIQARLDDLERRKRRA